MKTLPANIILEKNKIAADSAWIILIEIYLDDSTVLYFARNNEAITYDGQEYQAFPFELDAMKENARGEIPTLTLRVSNVTRIIQAYLEDYSGGVGKTVKLIVVNSENLTEDFAELEMEFEVLATTSSVQWVTFTLGAPNPLRQRFPRHRYFSNYCRWEFKSTECGYTGDATTCNHRLQDCRAYNNSSRFGGFPSLSERGYRVAY